MAAQPIPLRSADAARAEAAERASRPRMSTRNRLLFFLTAWLIVLMPFLFWWNTWFGRPLTNQQMGEYLSDKSHPRHIQHAIVQLGQRMSQHDPSVAQWYGDLLRLASHPREEVRSTDAWVMGQDPAGPGFHDTLSKMLDDPSLIVRGNAALSLVSFGDNSGREQIVSLLEPVLITSPSGGRITDAAKTGTPVHQGGLVATLMDDHQVRELRSPISGRVRAIEVNTGSNARSGTSIATIEPEEEQVWEALRALYLIGQPEDLPAVRPYQRALPEISDRVRKQALETEREIVERAHKSAN
jgi:Biotin-requiring enzyme